MQDSLNRLAVCLADTSLQPPRPFADLDMPATARRLLERELSRKTLTSAAVLVGIMAGDDGASILLTRRSEHLRNHPGQISFPGGSREENDRDLVATALRESYEEINLPVDLVDPLGFLPDYPTITGYRVTPVVALVSASARAALRPDGVEATELIDLPLEVALDASAYERKMIQRNGIDVPIFHLSYAHYDIWGATAGMLYQLCKLYHADHEAFGNNMHKVCHA